MTWDVPGYLAEELLGFGASGEVWRARAAVTGEVVALKRLRAGGDGAEHDRLWREAAVLAAFQHPHVVRLHGLLSTLGGPVLVLDYAEGGSLGGLVTRCGPCSPVEVAGLLGPIAAALAAAHAVGLVHGDVSAGNILLDGDGHALLADLGTARLVGDGAGSGFGTAGFIDPAVRAGGSPGPAADVYGLAAVAVYALTGIRGLDDPASALVTAAVPHLLDAVLRRALDPDPALRPSATEVAAVLADVLAEVPPDATEPAPGVVRQPAGDEAALALTHAVNPDCRPQEAQPTAGRHRRAAIGVRRHRQWLRPAAMRVAVAVVLIAVAVGIGLFWGGATGQQPAGASAAPGPPPLRPRPPASWEQVWADLDARRARAFATADAMLLGQVYLPGCPALPVDLVAVRSLAARHAHATGVQHQASRVRPESVSADSVTLVIVDRMRGYDIRDAAGRVLAHTPARGDRVLKARLVRTGQGWRIADLSP